MPRNLIASDAMIKAAKPGDGRNRLTDGDGLYLLLFVKGGAHGWRFDYTAHGRRNTLSMGTYPDTSLALARRKADAARHLVAEGIDPSQKRKAEKAGYEQARVADERDAKRAAPARLVRGCGARVVRCQARWLGTQLRRQDHRAPRCRRVSVPRSRADHCHHAAAAVGSLAAHRVSWRR